MVRNLLRDIQQAIVVAVITTLTGPFTSLFNQVRDEVIPNMKEMLSPETMIVILSSVVPLSVTLTVLLIRSFRARIREHKEYMSEITDVTIAFKQDYTFDDRLCVWVHKTQNRYGCPSCFIENREAMMKRGGHRFTCLYTGCKTMVVDQDDLPPKPTRAIVSKAF